jgi:ATP synthase protein I
MMSKSKRPLDELEERIKSARARGKLAAEKQQAKDGHVGKGMGVAARILAELIAAMAVGIGLGLWLDSQLDSKPVMLILGIILGWAAAILNIMRAVSEMERKAKAQASENQGQAKKPDKPPASSDWDDEEDDW